MDEHNLQSSVVEYLSGKKRALLADVRRKQTIYLDLKYWIKVREAVSGAVHDPLLQRIAELLLSFTEKGLVLCPASDVIIMEVAKQQDPALLFKSLELISKLSGSVALDSLPQRIGYELSKIAFKSSNTEEYRPKDAPVWTKAAFAFGDAIPVNEMFSPEDMAKVQIGFIDYIWDRDIKEVFQHLANRTDAPITDYDAIAEELNEQSDRHSSEINSYATAFRIEFAGVLSLFSRYLSTLPYVIEKGDLDIKDIRLESVPSLRIQAACQAYVRWDKRRKLEGNDILDFQHACAALPYCDAFLTEHDLRNIITAGNTQLDRKHGCMVLSEYDKALSYLEKIGSA